MQVGVESIQVSAGATCARRNQQALDVLAKQEAGRREQRRAPVSSPERVSFEPEQELQQQLRSVLRKDVSCDWLHVLVRKYVVGSGQQVAILPKPAKDMSLPAKDMSTQCVGRQEIQEGEEVL